MLERLILAAPPVLFQEREESAACNLTVVQLLLEQQLGLVAASHCQKAGECPDINTRQDIYKCKSAHGVGDERHYGLNKTKLGATMGYADFLFTMVCCI